MKVYPQIIDLCTYNDRNGDEWAQDWDFYVDQVLSKAKGPQMDVQELPVAQGDTVFSLVIRYNSGDSFGNATGKGELIWLFSSEEKAKAAQAVYEKAIENEDHSVELPLEMGDGEIVLKQVSNIAYDYFDTLMCFSITKHSVE